MHTHTSLMQGSLDFTCSRLRIELDCTVSGSWVELDAVCIIGKRHNLRKCHVSILQCTTLHQDIPYPEYAEFSMSVFYDHKFSPPVIGSASIQAYCYI